jgi:hypothetical protein
MKLRTCVSVSTLSLLLAAPALAQQFPTNDPSYGATDPTLGGGPEAFGAPGQMLISSSFDIDFRFTKQSFMSLDRSIKELVISPELMFFLIPNLAIGGTLAFDYTSGEDLMTGGDYSNTSVGIGPLVAYNFWIGPRSSVFPTLGVLYNHTSFEIDQAGGKLSASGYDISLLVRVPVLFHPFQHVFVGVTPFTEIDLVSKQEDMDTWKTTTFGITLDIGFWL